MATGNLNNLPRPENIEEARYLGGEYMQSLMKLRPVPVVMTPEQTEAIIHAGRAIGYRIFTEGAPWTIDEFQKRIREFAA